MKKTEEDARGESGTNSRSGGGGGGGGEKRTRAASSSSLMTQKKNKTSFVAHYLSDMVSTIIKDELEKHMLKRTGKGGSYK